MEKVAIVPTAPKNTYIICEARVLIAHVFNIFQHYRNRFPSKELIEFFNGAILAVTGNAVHQVHRPRAGFFAAQTDMTIAWSSCWCVIRDTVLLSFTYFQSN